MLRVGLDIGGTFTDLVCIDEKNLVTFMSKVPSTPDDFSKGVFDAIKSIGLNVKHIDLFVHGTTVALNCLINKTGSRVGFITTMGFRDVLEFGFERPVEELYNFLWRKPSPLVPRNLRFCLSERIDHAGKVIRPVDQNEVKKIAEELKKRKVESVAICLINSYANPEHEITVANLIKQNLPDVYVSVSHQITREFREFKRAYTTVINAYIQKAVTPYFNKLEEGLQEEGFQGQLLIATPEGAMDVNLVKDTPIFIVSSGPIGGIVGATYIANAMGLKDVVTMDVGGTSFDVAVIKDGKPIEQREYEVAGYPILLSSIAVQSIGAGGGSIAWVDEGGALHVGPHSAGSDPGPMCYGKGGKEPTVTDAAVVTGLLDPNYFLGGKMPLKRDLAEIGVRMLANKLGLDLYETADGILTIAKNNMANAMSRVLISRGYDPRDFTIISYGGAGGLFAADLAKELSISQIVIPPNPAYFSAWGLLYMDIGHTFTRTYVRHIDMLDAAELLNTFREMEIDGKKLLKLENEEGVEALKFMDMCYEGQGHYVEVPFPSMVDVKTLKYEITDSFNKVYQTTYGHKLDLPLKIVNLKVKIIKKTRKIPLKRSDKMTESIPREALKGKRNVFYRKANMEFNIYERDRLLPGNSIKGPAIVEEPSHVTVVLPNQTLCVDMFRNLIIKNV
jgi:N-methylhydantoinase A